MLHLTQSFLIAAALVCAGANCAIAADEAPPASLPVADAALPASQPTSRPAPKPTLVTVDLDATTAPKAMAELARLTGITFRFVNRQSTKKFDLHAHDRPLLEVIADICRQGGVAPVGYYGDTGLFLESKTPLVILAPTELTLAVIDSVSSDTRLQVGSSAEPARTCSMQIAFIPDPASGISCVAYGLDIDHLRGDDGTIYPIHDNNSWNIPEPRMDGMHCWNVQANFNLPKPLAKVSISGVIRVYVPEDFTEINVDDLTTPDKSVGDADLKCTVAHAEGNTRGPAVWLTLDGTNLHGNAAYRTAQFLRSGAITATDDEQRPLPVAINANPSDSSVKIELRPKKANDWKEGGPAAIKIRLPKSAHQIEIPLEIPDLTIP